MLDLRDKSITLIGADCNHIEKLIAVADYCESLCRFAAVKLLTDKPLPDDRIVLIPPLTSARAYNEFVFKQLASYVETDYALLVQHDGYIQNPAAWTDEFLAYDYIGAPWTHGEKNVGNGGFTLRSRRLLDILHTDEALTQTMPEDLHICRTYREHLEARGIRFAPETLAARFSFEGNSKYGFAWHGQFGFHNFVSTLGMTVPYPVVELSLSVALKHLVFLRLKSLLGNAEFVFRQHTVNDTIRVSGELLLTFLTHLVIMPIARQTVGRGRCTYEIEIREHEAYPDSVWLLVRIGDDNARESVSDWTRWAKVFQDDDVIFEREIPRVQRSFENRARQERK